MEDYNDLEKITGSPTAGESEFVHVEPIDSASTNGSSINQDDGIMVTKVDTIQLEPNDQRLTEDGGNEEFVDCPDDLISIDGKTDFDENENTETSFGDSTEILPHHYQEEKRQLMAEITELSNIRHQLLTEQSQKDETIQQLYANIDLKDREIDDLNMKTDRILSISATVFGDEEFPDTTVNGKLSHIEKNASIVIHKYNCFLYEVEMVNKCLTQVKSDYQRQTEMEKVLFFAREELISLKRKEFELVNKSRYLEDEYGKLMQQLVKSNQTVEILNSENGMLKGEVEVHKTKIINTKEKLNMAVTKGKSLVQQRDSLKQAVFEKTNELDKCLIELQEKSRALEAANSLNESLLQRDIILKKCEEILTFGEEVKDPKNLESRVSWLLESLNIAKNESISLQDEINTIKEAASVEIDRLTVSLLVKDQERNYLEDEFANLKDENGSLQIDLKRSEDKTVLLREKLSMAVKKGKSLVQERAEKNAQIEALMLELKDQETTVNEYRDQISKLLKDVGRIEKLESELLCLEQEGDQVEALKIELKQQEATINDYRDQISKLSKDVGRIEKLESELLCLKEERSQNEALKLGLKQQEATINDYRDQISKLSKDVEQIEKLESDILFLKEERNQIEALKLELKQQEATINNYRDQVSKLSKDVDRIEKLESDLLCLKEERNQIEQLLVDINLPVDLTGPFEKVKWCVTCINECKVEKSKSEQELRDLKDEVSMLTRKLTDALTTMKSLEDAFSVSEKHVLQLTEENKELKFLKTNKEEEFQKVMKLVSTLEDANEKAVNDRNLLQNEIKIIKEKTERKFMDESETIKTLEDALLKAENTISNLIGEKKNVEKEIKLLISACADVSKEMKFLVENNVLEKLDYNSALIVGVVDDVALADNKVVEEMLSASRNVRSVIEHCVDVKQNMLATIKDLRGELEKNKSTYEKVKEENNIFQNRVFTLETELEKNKSMYEKVKEENDIFQNSVFKLEAELEKNKSIYEKVKEENEIFQNRVVKLETELEKNESIYEKVKEENGIFQNRVFMLENEIEALKNKHDEMSNKLEKYRAKEDVWNKKEAELSKQITAFMKNHEDENDLLSASEIKSLFNKINEIVIPFPNITSGEIEGNDSDPIKKLFYIMDNVNELLDQITLLTHSNKELQSTLSNQTLEIKHLKKEFEEAINDKKELFELSVGVERVIKKFGGDESDADVAGMLIVLERLITDIILDNENLKDKANEVGVKLLDTQKVVEELEYKIKLLEEFNQNQKSLLESVHERGGGSEISEVEDPVSLGKRATPLVRTLRREPNDHLALNIDSESNSLIDKNETVEDKGHIFKSLHTSGLVPPQGKIIADRLDGIWVTVGGALMSRPRARLGLIAYWVVLHLWLLGTLL